MKLLGIALIIIGVIIIVMSGVVYWFIKQSEIGK